MTCKFTSKIFAKPLNENVAMYIAMYMVFTCYHLGLKPGRVNLHIQIRWKFDGSKFEKLLANHQNFTHHVHSSSSSLTVCYGQVGGVTFSLGHVGPKVKL